MKRPDAEVSVLPFNNMMYERLEKPQGYVLRGDWCSCAVLESQLEGAQKGIRQLLRTLASVDRDRSAMMSEAVHHELLSIADDRANLADTKVQQLEHKVKQDICCETERNGWISVGQESATTTSSNCKTIIRPIYVLFR